MPGVEAGVMAAGRGVGEKAASCVIIGAAGGDVAPAEPGVTASVFR